MSEKISIIGEKIRIVVDDMQVFRLWDNIRFCEVNKHLVDFHFANGEVITAPFSMKKLELLLPDECFGRCHNKYIVHLKLVLASCIITNKIVYKKVVAPPQPSKKELLTEGGIENPKLKFHRIVIPISRKRRVAFYEKVAKYNP